MYLCDSQEQELRTEWGSDLYFEAKYYDLIITGRNL